MGMMGTMATSMAGSMAGSMLGNQLSGMMGGTEAAPAQVAPAQPAAPQQGWAQSPQFGQAPALVACQLQSRDFMACMNESGQNIEPCRHLFEAMKACNDQAQSTPQ